MSREHYIYTSAEEAKEAIAERWKNEALRRKVELHVGEIPEPLRDQPRAWLGRYVASPDNEFFRFLELAERVNLKPLEIEALDDKFHKLNIDKMKLAEMAFLDPQNSNHPKKAKIIHFKKSHMRSFNEVKTLWGENFVGFHHRLYNLYAANVQRFDVSTWFETHGKDAKSYYPHLLSLFVCHGILFEDFVTNAYEAEFFNDVVSPAFEQCTKRFGVRPLIVRIFSDEELSRQYSWCYPEYISSEVAKYA